jgi:hypothetical protein
MAAIEVTDEPRIRAAKTLKSASTRYNEIGFSGSDSFPEEESDVHEN